MDPIELDCMSEPMEELRSEIFERAAWSAATDS
jgi:hypothetical protein